MIQRSPAGRSDGGDGTASAGGAPDTLDSGSSGKTTVQDPPARKTLDVHGKTLAEVAAALPPEPGAVEFDISVSSSGDPMTRATVVVHQTLTMPRWVERDGQSAPVKKAWDTFHQALAAHEDGHLAIDRREFADAQQRFIGKPADETQAISDQLRQDVQARHDAYDAQTDHGRTGNPPTILDTSPDTKSPLGGDGGAQHSDARADDEPPASPAQAKLEISQPGDPDEQQADLVADRVMQQPDDGPVMAEAGAPDAGSHASESAADVWPHGGQQGQPLDATTQAFMETRIGHDFSHVRIHAGADAATSARRMQARAYTVGHDVVFGHGQYAPGTSEGRWLLAHELTHVVQQNRGASRKVVRRQKTGGTTAPASVAVPEPNSTQAAPANPAAESVAFKGLTFTSDAAQLRKLLETLVAEKGQSEAETVAYGFLRMPVEDKVALQLRGVDPAVLQRVQRAFEPVLTQLQSERAPYLTTFETEAAAATREVLRRSKEALLKEKAKYGGDDDAKQVDADGLRAAAKDLMVRRQAADAAAAVAKESRQKYIDQNARPTSNPFAGGRSPQVPYLPNQELRDQARTDAEKWWKLEEEYGAQRVQKEKTFPTLAMYSYNEDGQAASRLDTINTWGPFANSRAVGRVAMALEEKIQNNTTALADMDDAAQVWTLPRMLDLAARQKSAKAHEHRWIKEQAAKLGQEKKDREALIAAVTIGVSLVAIGLSLGTLAIPAGAAGAAIIGGLATGAQAASAGLTIYTAFAHLQEYGRQVAATDTALDKANAIAGDDPSFFWVAVDLAAAALEIGALKAAFVAMKQSITAARTARSVEKLTSEVHAVAQAHGLPKATAEGIVARVSAEIEAASATAAPLVVDAETALGGLKDLGSLGTAGERGRAVIQALEASGDVTEVLTRSGKSASELIELVGKESAAANRLKAALSRKAYDTVGPKLRETFQLSDEAIARVCSRVGQDKIKGQLLEEIMERVMLEAMADPASATRQSLLKGAEGELKTGTPEFVAGRRITDVHGDELTDGMIGILRDGLNGDKEIVVIRALEAKAGRGARQTLSTKSGGKIKALSDLSESDDVILEAAALLRRRNPALKKSLREIAAAPEHEQELVELINREFSKGEFGQATKTTQRLSTDVSLTSDVDVPAEILVDGVRRKVVFAGGKKTPQVTGVLASDGTIGKLGESVGRKQAAKLDITRVSGIKQAQLNSVSQEIQDVKGFGGRAMPPPSP